MYFRNVICTVALATLASAAVAKQIPTPYSSESEVYDDEVDEVYEREADADPARTAAWEEAHGGTAPSYHYGEEHDAGAWHVARDAEAEAEPGWTNGQPPAWLASLRAKASKAVKNVVPTVKPFTKQNGGLKKHHGSHKSHPGKHAHTRDVEDDEDFDLSDEDYEQIQARDVDLDIPDFGDEEVDTSLEGLLEARDVNVDEDGEDFEADPPASEQDLSGYDEEFLQRRSDDNEADYYTGGTSDLTYDDESEDDDENPHQARDVSADEDEDYDAYLQSEEHRSLLESIGVTKRDVDDDIQDAEEFDEELFARQENIEDEVPNFGDEDVDTSLEGLLNARGLDEDEGDDEIPDFDGDVDTSLEGMEDGPVHARGVDDEDLEDADDVDGNADAAYADEEVAEELVAPAVE